MRMASLTAVLVPLLILTACRAEETGIDAVVIDAKLEEAEAITLVMLGGATWGEAIMTFTDTAGVVRQVPVAFGGPAGGLVMDVHVSQEDFLFDGSTTASLQIPEGGVAVDELFGLYDGGGGGIALGLGFCDLQIDNDAGVRLVITGACGGLALARSENWLTLSSDGEIVELEP